MFTTVLMLIVVLASFLTIGLYGKYKTIADTGGKEIAIAVATVAVPFFTIAVWSITFAGNAVLGISLIAGVLLVNSMIGYFFLIRGALRHGINRLNTSKRMINLYFSRNAVYTMTMMNFLIGMLLGGFYLMGEIASFIPKTILPIGIIILIIEFGLPIYLTAKIPGWIQKAVKKKLEQGEELEMSEFIPVGSVVKMRNIKNLVFIVQRAVVVNDRYFDYGGASYPQGVLGDDNLIYFNDEDLAFIEFLGYETDSEKQYAERLAAAKKKG